jgi:alkanesulfonate monooxygenase SsuD/methylene tetrahydromethanopterin reductase-like flavin-dependent oxidoreductase (luciferase family)
MAGKSAGAAAGGIPSNTRMKYSMFSVQDHHPGLPRSLGQFYGEIRDQVMLADRLGFYAYFVAEHHFHEYGVYPNPAVALANLAAVTSRIRLGPAVTILPFRNPLTVAEDYAMLDQLSGGRVELGVGSGYLIHEFAGFNADGKTKREKFDEGLAVLKQALSGERFSFKGRFFEVNDVALNVTPVQKPYPPIYVAVLRREAAYHVGKQGNKLMTVPYAAVDTFEDIAPMLAEYHKGFAESAAPADYRDSITTLHTYVTTSDEAARAEAAEAFDLYVRTRLYAKSQVYDDIMTSGLALFGSVETVVEKLVRLWDMGVGHVSFLINFGALDHKLVCASMDRIAREVVPEVEKRIAAKARAA